MTLFAMKMNNDKTSSRHVMKKIDHKGRNVEVKKKALGAYAVVAPTRADGAVSFDLSRSEDNPLGEWKLSGNTKSASHILGDPERALSFKSKRDALLYLAGALGCTCSTRGGHHANNCAEMMNRIRRK